MPSLESLKENMEKMKIAPEIMSQFSFSIPEGETYNGTVRKLLAKMEELLTKEQRLALIQEEGCCVGGEHDIKDIEFAEKYSDKQLADKIIIINPL